jgi:carbamoyltransferase
MNILGISAYYHDSAATIIKDGEIIAACQEERYTRIKHDSIFPVNAIKFCLDYSGISITNLDAIVFYDKPLLKFERILETYFKNAPFGFLSFLKVIPIWMKDKIFLKKTIFDELSKFGKINLKQTKILFTEHHLAHAASAFFTSTYNESAILTIDGVGEWATTTIMHGYGNNIKVIKEIHYPDSVGLLYSAFTYFLGFKVNSGEYKLMGLSPYGNSNDKQTINYTTIIKEKLIKIFPDGSIKLNAGYFNYSNSLRMIKLRKWEKLFGIAIRKPETKIEQCHCNLAYAVQNVLEEIVLQLVKEAKKIVKSENLCLAGGVALNCLANTKIWESNIFSNIYIQPVANDAGGSLGAALAAYHMYSGKERKLLYTSDLMKGMYLGPEFSSIDINKLIRKYDAIYEYYQDFDDLIEVVTQKLEQRKIIGWFQGRMEFGPRALGNRSILADVRDISMIEKINLKIKNREFFRPFAPSVLIVDVDNYFEGISDSPYMLYVAKVKNENRYKLPTNYENLNTEEKLKITKSNINAVTHVDFTSRIQTVEFEDNPKFYNLLTKYKEKTGYGILINTSFNVRGEPIVCTPEDAYLCFINSDIDFFVCENFIFSKTHEKKINFIANKFKFD